MSRTWFTDRDLGNRFPEILAASGLHVEAHRHHFRPDCPDEEWLETIGRRGWIAVTHDSRIRYKPNELAAVVRHRVILLVVIGAAPFPELARNFVATVPKIEAFLQQRSAPLIAKLYRPSAKEIALRPDTTGRIEQWYPR